MLTKTVGSWVCLALTAFVLVGLSASPAHGSAPAAGPVVGDGSGPLAGYTIDNPPLPPLTTPAGPTTVTQGTYEHAAFDVEVPPHWNGQLVMWAHGSRGDVNVLTVDPPGYGLRQLFVDEGFAWAASSYYDDGFDVQAGIDSEHDLAARVSRALPARPSRTYLTGISMGGEVTAASIERYRGFYTAAMPMCGALGDDRLFDYVASYNLLAQDLAGVRAYPLPADYLTNAVPAIERTLGIDNLALGQDPRNALGRQLQAIVVRLTGGARPGAAASFSYWADPLFTFQTPDNGGSLGDNFGRVAQNVLTRYAPNTPVDVNRTVQRIIPTDLYHRLFPAGSALPRVAGDPRIPVLTLHDVGDLLLPLSMEQDYAREVAAHGESQLLVQRVVRSGDHCDFSPAETGAAWTALQRWVDAGGGAAARPAGDTVTAPRVVASAGYGCRFTDAAAYDDPTDYPTRQLFARCPGGAGSPVGSS